MIITEYLALVKQHILTSQIVVDFVVIRERFTTIDGYLRAKLIFTDHSWLEFSEYVHSLSDNQINVITYSYHWADKHNVLIFRWDNTPHFPNLPGFPHHRHQEPDESVVSPVEAVDIFKVLAEIAQRLE